MKQFVLIITFLILSASCISQDRNYVDSFSDPKESIANQKLNYQDIERIVRKGDDFVNTFPDSSLYYYKIALLLAQNENNIEDEANIYSKIGSVKYLSGEYDSSLENFVISLKKWRTEKNKQGIAKGLNNIALIYNMVNNYEEALEYHQNSIYLCKEIEDSSLLALNYFNTSLVYLNMTMLDSALVYANQSLEINTLANNKNELLKLNTLMGNIYFEKGEYDKARQLFLNVINNKTINNKWELSYALAGISAIEQKEGNFDLSIEYGIRSLHLAKEINATWDIQNTLKILSESYALADNYKKAYELYKEYKLYNDTLFNSDRKIKINYLNLKQKDFEYITLSHENELQFDQIQKRNNQILIAAIVAFFIAILAIIFLRNSYAKSKLNYQLRVKNAEIGKKNQQLVKLNATKDTFFKIIGHDLKNPLCTVISFTDMLENNFNVFSDSEKLEYISLSKSSAAHSLDMLDNLLEWTKSQSGIYSVNPVSTNLKSFVEEITDKHSNSFKEKDLKLTIDINEDVTGLLDVNMTTVVVRNLVTNAIKFTNRGGEIIVKAINEDGKVLITVSDDGIGIDSEKITGLFQIENARSTSGTNQEKGMGIGLILCKELVEKQNGQIWAKSLPGKGSDFYVKI